MAIEHTVMVIDRSGDSQGFNADSWQRATDGGLRVIRHGVTVAEFHSAAWSSVELR